MQVSTKASHILVLIHYGFEMQEMKTERKSDKTWGQSCQKYLRLPPEHLTLLHTQTGENVHDHFHIRKFVSRKGRRSRYRGVVHLSCP
jgi:hypothetical protein